jgi:hypothetical protein
MDGWHNRSRPRRCSMSKPSTTPSDLCVWDPRSNAMGQRCASQCFKSNPGSTRLHRSDVLPLRLAGFLWCTVVPLPPNSRLRGRQEVTKCDRQILPEASSPFSERYDQGKPPKRHSTFRSGCSAGAEIHLDCKRDLANLVVNWPERVSFWLAGIAVQFLADLPLGLFVGRL